MTNEWINDSGDDGDDIFLFLFIVATIENEIMIQSTVFEWSSKYNHASD